MNDKDYIKELFSEKLSNYEAKVNPELWNAISSSIGTTAGSAAATGLSIATKWIIGVAITGAAVVTTIVLTTGEAKDKEVEINSPKIVQVDDSALVDNEKIVAEQETLNADTQRANHQSEENVSVNEQRPQENQTNVEGPPSISASDEKLTPHSVLNNPVIEERIIQDMEHREPVHTPDPVVHEPMLPEEVVAEEHHELNNDYVLGALPNVFTPNGDGKNDIFRIESENLTEFYIAVIDAKSNVVFESRDPLFVWDGRDSAGNPVVSGNYVYFITAKEFGTEKPKRFSPLLIQR